MEENKPEIKWLSDIQYVDEHGDNCLYFGNTIVGVWYCKCKRRLFPRQLEELYDNNKVLCDKEVEHFICMDCGSNFEYDEEA